MRLLILFGTKRKHVLSGTARGAALRILANAVNLGVSFRF
jgi:hypothetical protein